MEALSSSFSGFYESKKEEVKYSGAEQVNFGQRVVRNLKRVKYTEDEGEREVEELQREREKETLSVGIESCAKTLWP